jgi:hypothetical protein
MSVSEDIDRALMAKLSSDAQLLALCPDNVWWDISPQGATRWVKVSLTSPRDEAVFGGRAFEDIVYLVVAVILTTAGSNANATAAQAAERIEELLDEQVLTVSGYTHMAMFRDPELPRVRVTERDGQNVSLLWYQRGIYVRVQQALVPSL